MFRYIGFVWNDEEPEAGVAAAALTLRLRSAGEWQLAFRCNGIAVFCSGGLAGSSDVFRLQDGAGVILGKLFSRASGAGSMSTPFNIGSHESADIVRTRGRHLVDRYWGRYVAFLHSPGARMSWVLRDPTGMLPCQAMRLDGVDVFFSWPDDASKLAGRDFAISWKYVAASLCYMRVQSDLTALEGVSQVLGGECVELHEGTVKRSFYWHPMHVAEQDAFEDADEAARELRRTARDCVQAWASCYGSIIHTLSGGLDSSIVMACLQDMPAPPVITCVNYHSPDADGDERGFARLMADRAGQPLIERERSANVSFEPLLAMHRSSVPPPTVLYYLENSAAEAQLARDNGATAIFSGDSGDQLFYQYNASLAAADYLQRHGLRPALFGAALDAARMDRFSVWTVLADALSRGFFGRQWTPREGAGQFRPLLSAAAVEAVQADDRFLHPLFRSPERFPSGKLFHAYSLLFAPSLHPPVGPLGGPERVAPLYSQPLIEVLLRTPLYLLTMGGWDRAVARRAFQHDMPREIVTRQTKGGIEEHAKAIFLRNIALIRQVLSNGSLVDQGIIDRQKLREVLSGGPTRLNVGTVELFDYFAAEAWARRWRDAGAQRAAA